MILLKKVGKEDLDLNLNDLSKNTILQLREFGKEIGVKGVTRYKKSQLIEKIQERLTEMSKSQMNQLTAEQPSSEDVIQQDQAQPEPAPPVKRRRGRPRKSESAQQAKAQPKETAEIGSVADPVTQPPDRTEAADTATPVQLQIDDEPIKDSV
ncbi:MAG: Rho termination factor N-terminal domain-containing protein, partial [Caldicoprobacterales bacterium]